MKNMKYYFTILMFFIMVVSSCMQNPSNTLEADIFSEPNHDIGPQGKGLWDIQALHDANITGKNVKVAVLDSGIDLNHPDLVVEDVKNFVSNSDSSNDYYGHGTKIAGIIGARKNEFGLLGVAPDVELYIGKVANDKGYVKADDLVKGIQWAIEQQVDIINISIEIDQDFENLHQAIKLATDKNIIVLASAGNKMDEEPREHIAYPGYYDEVIAVGMLTPEGKLSEQGFQHSKIDIYVPGEDIISTYPGGKLTLDTGSSFATAYASGYVALFIQKFIENNDIYSTESIIQGLQSVFHQYMQESYTENIPKMMLNVWTISKILVLGLGIYLLVRWLKRSKPWSQI